MARYFRNSGNGYAFGSSFPGYSVLSDTVDQEGGGKTIHAMGYVNMHYTPSSEEPNFDSDGHPMKRNATELFTHRPAELHVNTMYADRRVRPHMMTIMAIAKMDHPDADIVASDQLSRFSSHLVQSAHKRGLVKANSDNPEMTASAIPSSRDGYSKYTGSEEDARRSTGALVWQGVKEIPHSEVMAGKQFLKQTLRPDTTKKQTPKTQSEQPQLPGME